LITSNRAPGIFAAGETDGSLYLATRFVESGGSMKAMHHVGITVKDLEASIRFYHDVLGLQFSNEPSPWFDGEELAAAVGVPGAALRQVSLLLGDTTLELLEYKSPPSETTMPLKSNNRGASHVGFLVDDIAAKKAELEAKGVEFYGPVNFVDEGVLAGWRWVYFGDPDGYPLELVEVAYVNADERGAGIAAYLASRS
jgi:catechol 2,3-dioxygenase-like lactoylglutathione lyase family enzyme